MDELKEKSFLQKHWKKIVVGTLVLGGLIVTTFGIKKYISNLPIEKYSREWLESLSKDALEAEREKVRLEFVASGSDRNKAIRLQNLLYAFDDEMARRRPEVPSGPIIHREHGRYLPNDD